MPGRIVVECSACSAKLAVSDESKLGKKLKCPKCSEVFVAKAAKASGGKSAAPTKSSKGPPAKAKAKSKPADDDEFNFDDMDMEDKSADTDDEESEDEAPASKSKASGKKAAPAKGKAKGKSGKSKLPFIIGGSAVAVVLIGVVLWMVLGGKEEPAPVAQNPPPAAPPPAAPAPAADSPNDKILALKWLPQDTELIIHLKIADVWQAPLLQGLLSSLPAQAGVAQMQQVTGLTPADLDSVTIGVKSLSQLQAAGMMMALGGPPPTDAAGLIVVRSKKPVEVSQLQQLLVQMSPDQSAKLADHGGKPYVEGPPTKPGGKPFGLWFADPSTLLVGPSDELTAVMDRGETVTPRNEFRAIDATPHLLFAIAPLDSNFFTQLLARPVAQGNVKAAEMQSAMKDSLQAVSLGVSVTGGVALQSSLVSKDSAGVAKLKPWLDAIVTEFKTKFAEEKSSMPEFAGELLELLFNNVQIAEQNQTLKIATNIPDSAQDKLQQLPTMLMGLAAMRGLNSSPPADPNASPTPPANSPDKPKSEPNTESK